MSSYQVKIYRYNNYGSNIEVFSADKFDTEEEAESFAYFDPFVLAEHQFDIYKKDNALDKSGYYAEIR